MVSNQGTFKQRWTDQTNLPSQTLKKLLLAYHLVRTSLFNVLLIQPFFHMVAFVETANLEASTSMALKNEMNEKIKFP